ncbi:MAG: hypothetical protein ABEJ08_01575 [Halobacteriaceae archaeon]
MDRRSMLAACAAAATALAGCSASPNDGDTARPSPGTPTSTPTPTTATDSTPLAVRSVDAPGTVELGKPYTVGFAVENPTDGERTLETPVSVRARGEWRPFTSISARVPPGSTTVEREFAAPRFLGTYRFRLQEPTAEWRIEATERRLAFGEPFTTPQNLSLVVLGGRFTDAYDAGGNSTVTPPPDRQFLLVRVRLENPTGGSVTLPPLGAFQVRAGDGTYQVALNDPGQRVSVESGNRKRIELPFLVPGSVSAADVAVRWAPRYRPGRTVVVWRRE